MFKVYSGLKGFTVFLIFMAGMVMIGSVFFWGFTKAVELILPLLVVVAYFFIIVFVLGFLPAALIKHLRPALALYSVLMSHVLGVAAWTMSFLFVVKAFGYWAIFFALLFQFLAPVAIIGALYKGAWYIAVHLVIWTGFSFGMKSYSQWLMNLAPRRQTKGDIIDVDVAGPSESQGRKERLGLY
jgi:hypothetical protein